MQQPQLLMSFPCGHALSSYYGIDLKVWNQWQRLHFGRKLKLREVRALTPDLHTDIKKIPCASSFKAMLLSAYQRGYLRVTRDPLLAGFPFCL
jgi:hypothetical protein